MDILGWRETFEDDFRHPNVSEKEVLAGMINRSLGTQAPVGLEHRLAKRLADAVPGAFDIETHTRGAFTFCDVTVRLAEKKALECLAETLNNLLIKDWLPVHLLGVIDSRYPHLPPEARLKVLLDSICHANTLGAYNDNLKLIRSLLKEDRPFILEGFARFRLKEACAFWESCVEYAAEGWLLAYETQEFLKILRSFADVQQPRTGDVTVSATPSGEYELLDEFGCKIEDDAFSISGAIAKEDALISLLVAVAPKRIWVCGVKREAEDAIASVFGSRARFITD